MVLPGAHAVLPSSHAGPSHTLLPLHTHLQLQSDCSNPSNLKMTGRGCSANCGTGVGQDPFWQPTTYSTYGGLIPPTEAACIPCRVPTTQTFPARAGGRCATAHGPARPTHSTCLLPTGRCPLPPPLPLGNNRVICLPDLPHAAEAAPPGILNFRAQHPHGACALLTASLDPSTQLAWAAAAAPPTLLPPSQCHTAPASLLLLSHAQFNFSPITQLCYHLLASLKFVILVWAQLLT